MKTRKKLLSFLLVLTLITTSLPAQIFANEVVKAPINFQTDLLDSERTTPAIIDVNPNIFVGDGYEVEFKVSDKDSATFTGEILLTNTGKLDLENWSLEFSFDHEIIDLKNAVIKNHNNSSYTIKGLNGYANIPVGQSVNILLKANYYKEIILPTYYVLDEEMDFENYPLDEYTYRLWKEKIIKKQQQNQLKQNTDSTYMRSLAATEPTSGTISNENLRFTYENGRYTIYTTGGDPANDRDNNARLLYPGTSYTTVRIDGVNHTFTPDTVTRYDNKIIGTKLYNDIIVSQHISIISNQYTKRDDVVEFFYTVENTSSTPHNVGIRIMFDTMLGGNDSAPFRLPALGNVTTETDLKGEHIPEFWQAFDSLSNPAVIAQGTLNLDKASTPDRARFTNWGAATSSPWDYTRAAGSPNGDSAVALYWNERSLAKDDIFTCKTFYGLSALQQDLRPPLAVALTGATKLEVIKNKDGKEEYSPNPFTVTAYIQNIGTGTALNSKIMLNLPQGMEIVEGNRTVNLGSIPVGTTQHQISWKVKVAPSSVEKVEKYGVTVTADNADPKTLEREITIPKLQISNIKPLRKDANAYVEFGFNSSTKKLQPGQSASISARMNNSSWANMIVTNDYSYIGNNKTVSSGYVAWEYMPVYNINNLNSPILGIEPPIDTTGLEPDLLVEFKPSAVGGKNYMNLGIRLTNTGLVPLDLGDLDIKYYYTNDEGYPQSIAGHYIGGRIDNKWPNITSKSKVKVIEMDEPKQLADTYVNVTFDKDAGTLAYEDYVELNLQVYNTNWLRGDYILENDHSYQTNQANQVRTFALSQSSANTPGMVVANNIVVATSLPWNWGKAPKELEGYFASFKIGQGDTNSNTNGDVKTFQQGMIGMGMGVVPNYGAKNNIATNNVIFTQDNLKALFEADIAYISTHGFQGGVLPIYKSASDASDDYNQIITADINVLEWKYTNNKTISPNNRFSINMKDNLNKGWTENLKWLVLAACKQMDNEEVWNGETTVKKWVDVMNNNTQLRGIMGYYGSANDANDALTDVRIMENFTKSLKDNKSVTSAWKQANQFQIFRAAVWGYLVKDTCEDDTLAQSISNSSSPDYSEIFLYTKEYKKVEFPKQTVANESVGINSAMISQYSENDLIGSVKQHLTNEGILIDQYTDVDMQIFKKDTYNREGNHVKSEIEEYIITLVPDNTVGLFSIQNSSRLPIKEVVVTINNEGVSIHK